MFAGNLSLLPEPLSAQRIDHGSHRPHGPGRQIGQKQRRPLLQDMQLKEKTTAPPGMEDLHGTADFVRNDEHLNPENRRIGI